MMTAIEGNLNHYNNNVPTGGNAWPPFSGNTDHTLLPMYGSAVTDYLQTAKTNQVKSDSGLTYALPISRKRSRDCCSLVDPSVSFPNGQVQSYAGNGGFGSFTFLGEDVSLQIQQQQFEIDQFVSQHTEKMRMEIEQRRKRNSRRIIAVVEEEMLKRLRVKEEEISKMAQLNWALEERVKSLYIENQIWRNLAQTNEATANALRSNIENLLEQHQNGGAFNNNPAAMNNNNNAEDDAESCCGSNFAADVEERRTLANSREEADGGGAQDKSNDRLCRHCGTEESCVLLLPCRHLCLCTVCGSSVHACPLCNTPKNASLRVIIPS